MYVLFVDDDAANLIVWEAACSDEFPVLTATSAEQALQLMRQHEVAVLLADQRMPKTTGVELLETARLEFPETIRILITAYTDLPAAIDAINRGQVRRYLRKPCEPDELRNELADALEVYDLKRKMTLLERRLLQTERVYALGLVAASIAHEIRNPVSWIRDNIRLAREELRGVGRRLGEVDLEPMVLRTRFDEIDEELADALSGVQRIMDIVQSLELPTRESGDDSVEITEVLRLVLRIVRGELRRTAQVELDTKPVPKVRGTSTKLGQVVLNLIVNALQALANHSAEQKVITIQLDSDDEFVYLTMSDNGPGFPTGDADRIFDPFYTTKGAEGTGLGLAISRRIVEELGGSIRADERPGGGARFRLKLPISRSS